MDEDLRINVPSNEWSALIIFIRNRPEEFGPCNMKMVSDIIESYSGSLVWHSTADSARFGRSIKYVQFTKPEDYTFFKLKFT